MAEDKKTNGGKEKRTRRPSAAKRDLQSLKRYLRNRSFKAKVNTAVRSLKGSLTQKNAEAVKANLSSVYSLMDKGVKKGIFKLNKANRVKARLTAATR